MKKDILNRYHVHRKFEYKGFNVWFNWRPSVLYLGGNIVISRDYVELEISLYFNLTISIIWR
jgi:hypothetical protein